MVILESDKVKKLKLNSAKYGKKDKKLIGLGFEAKGEAKPRNHAIPKLTMPRNNA